MRRNGAAASRAEHRDLLRELEALGEAELAAWAAAHRDRLSLPFLGWLSDEELASAASEPQRQQTLWELGSRLMALREGLSPVANEVLQAELRAAALSCSGADSSSSSDSSVEEAAGMAASDTDAADAQRRQQRLQDAAAQQAQRAQQGQAPAALATPSFASAVQRTAALGLSPEGMVLFEQQAAALEAVVGTSRAKSLTEVIGRARVQEARQVQRLAESDAAVRILDVLLSVHDRQARAAMLPDAFTPPGSTAAVDDDADYFSPDEDQVFTSPLRLLQAIDLYLARLQGGRGGPPDAGARSAAQLTGASMGLTLPQMLAALKELREDVEAYWSGSGSDSDA
ncbi:mitochondrial presequence translocase subunit Tim44 [Chlorella sorokiniana]|uniref:Mitochondrial presequence translocase subunit Tim44 n=1 Tax=Chlorella sorokiniana TaxID=3076 RepID=A0A2P6TTE5_CHLSO|nr:mitochondrial presequence translocase subunit Tim44 [Chlorella sorokiniana]|eukprot:PRW57338.1 mitochondrial presequence translocase subunit Tim44 [Chlorella sorokiniana]